MTSAYIGRDSNRVHTLPHKEMMSPTAGPWEGVTIAGVREAILNHRITSMMLDDGDDATQIRIFSTVHDALLEATIAGRTFDLGYLPNEVLISESRRAGTLYTAGHIGHPFRRTYLLFHKWELGGALYMVKADPKTSNNFTAMEFQCLTVSMGNYLVLGDAVEVECGINAEGDYRGRLLPSAARLAAMTDSASPGYHETPANAIGNVVDPILACMLLLATDGVQVDKVEPSAKLNKARAKNRKTLIPPYWQVATQPYVTAFTTKRAHKTEDGEHGHHRSPVPHLRRGHVRNLSARHGGGVTWIRDALVNLKDPNSPLSRSFYQMQQEREKSK